MKIAIFTDTFVPDVNGVAKTLHRYTEFLKRNHIEYRIFAPKASKENQFSKQILSFRSLPFFLYPECRIAFPSFPFIREELLDFNPDIIHVATPFNIGLSGKYYAKKLGIPIVGSYHTDFDKYLSHYHLQSLTDILWKYLTWFHRSLEKIFVPSQDTKERLAKRQFKHLSIWPRGIDGDIFHKDYDPMQVRKIYQIKEKHILLYVGRIASEKDVMLLPEIADQLPDNIQKDVHWLVVGDGPMKEVLLEIAPENMTLAGFVEGEDLAAIYAASDVFVFPSASETFGNVVLEALACATPVVGANAGGVRTIIQDGQTGFLCVEKDAKSFAEATVYLLENERIRKQMSEDGYTYAQSQSWDTIFYNLIDEYNEVLTRHAYKKKKLA